MTQQFQLLFAFVLGDLFTPFLFQVAHFKPHLFGDYTTKRAIKISRLTLNVKKKDEFFCNFHHFICNFPSEDMKTSRSKSIRKLSA